MIDSGDKLKLDQTHLETVIPAPGTVFCSVFSLDVTARLLFPFFQTAIHPLESTVTFPMEAG